MNASSNHPRMSDEAAAGVGGLASVLSVLLGWLKPLGEIASSLSAIFGCCIAGVMLWRLIRSNSKLKN
jgi:hypothetical protein